MPVGDVRDVALAGCLSRVAALRGRVEYFERSYRDRAELPGSLLLLRALTVLVNETEHRLVSMRAQQSDSQQDDSKSDDIEIEELDRKNIAETVKTLETLVGICVSVVSVMHSRDFDPFVRPIGSLARTVAENTEIIFRPLPSHTSYQISHPLNLQLELHLTDAPTTLREQIATLPTIVYLNYPVTEEANSLHHLLIGHEIGHLALRRTIPGHDGPIGDALAREALTDYKRELGSEGGVVGTAELELLTERVTKWFVELACDRLGLKMVGPAYLLALFEHAALTSWFYDETQKRSTRDQQPSLYDLYPAMAWRVGALWELADEYISALPADPSSTEAARQVFDAAHKMVPAWEPALTTTEGKIVTEALEGYKTVEKTLLADGAAEYGRTVFTSDLHLVWEKLDNGIAPAERVCSRRSPLDSNPPVWRKGTTWSVPVDWRSILNGGYIHWLRWAWGDDTDGGRLEWRRRREDRHRADQLLQGAVELSEMQAQASRLKRELGQLRVDTEVV